MKPSKVFTLSAVALLLSLVAQAGDVPTTAGAISIPFTMPADGQATVAIYNKEGRVIRILGQLLELSKGSQTIRWDGLDLWGNLVPADTELVVRVISNPGLKAFYEFTVGNAGHPPWMTAPVGEGDAMRTGGWLADHSPPIAAGAVGDRVFLGSPLAEHAHSLIAVNLQGDKIWGGGLKGWNGPAILAGDGQTVFALEKDGRDVYSINPATYARTKLFTLKTKADAMAVHAGQFYFASKEGLATVDAAGQQVSLVADAGDISAMACDADGTLFSVVADKLCRTVAGKHTVLNDRTISNGVSLAVNATQIAVGDDARQAVYLFDKAGKLLTTIGGKGWRLKGPFDPNTVEAPRGLTFDRQGNLWVAENRYSPKRVSKWSPDGKLLADFYGPAEYGGGGFLDPDLKHFYYLAQTFELDFDKGTSRLVSLPGRFQDPKRPMLDSGAMGNTKVGRPIYLNGHRYAVGDPGFQGSAGIVINLLDDGMTAWRPCVMMGSATSSTRDKKTNQRTWQLSGFLNREFWREHWDIEKLKDCSFIWCDRNGDGDYQIEEVEIFPDKNSFATAYWVNWLGPDLTFWGSKARLAPSRFTDRGVPIFESKNLQPFDYNTLAPVYNGSFTVGGGHSAKSGYGATSVILHDGSLVLEGQPYLVTADLKIKGGNPDVKPSDYIPRIAGKIMDQPLHFVGTAETKSPVGEVAMLNGNNGTWYVMADGVTIGSIFTGKDGSWSTDLKAIRGADVTGRKQDWECFFGHFLRANDGKHYVVAGHGFHAISRVEGLDDYRVQNMPLKVTAADCAANEKLRPTLVAAVIAGKTSKPKTAKFGPSPSQPLPIGDGNTGLSVAGTWSHDGLALTYRGATPTGNNSDDWRFLFKTGFCFDLMVRSNPNSKSAVPEPGDRRIVFGQHKGKWIGVLYDYVNPAAKASEGVDFASPLVSTRVARVVQLPETDAQIAFKKDGSGWSTDVFLKWNALGFPKAPGALRCDFGILTPNSGGTTVERRSYWSNRTTDMVADLGVEAEINPGAWGTVTLESK